MSLARSGSCEVERRHMKRSILVFLLFGFLHVSLHGASDAIAAVQRADAARVKATIAGDAARLGELLTDDLIYGHNDGRVQTKSEFISAVASNQVKYEAFDYDETKWLETAPHVVTVTGRLHLKVSRGATRVEFALRFLAVWREEGGQWRLHAYQSARLPDAPATSTAKANP
jgi:ketosteroid isomerase-like protein